MPGARMGSLELYVQAQCECCLPGLLPRVDEHRCPKERIYIDLYRLAASDMCGLLGVSS